VNKRVFISTLALVFLVINAAYGVDNIPEAARNHMIRGRTALEMARSPEEYKLAAEEFEQAVKIAPQWAEAHYNLAVVQAKVGNLQGAIDSYRRYLELSPRAPDAQAVRDELVKLGYMLERKKMILELGGRWTSYGENYEARLEDNRLVIYPLGTVKPKGVEVIFHGIGTFDQPVKGSVTERFEFIVEGLKLRGRYLRPSFVEETSGCTIPEDTSNVVGTVSADGQKIVLSLQRTKYRANYSGIFFGLESCKGVETKGRYDETLTLVRLQPEAGIGVRLQKIEGQWRIVEVTRGLPAAQAGLLKGDILFAVDGKEVMDLSEKEVQKLLLGERGTQVKVTIKRPDRSETQEFTLKRAKLTQ